MAHLTKRAGKSYQSFLPCDDGTLSIVELPLPGKELLFVIPRSEIAGTKPPYVCLGCFIHTYSNNMINRFHVQ
jgi:hypothetical protein